MVIIIVCYINWGVFNGGKNNYKLKENLGGSGEMVETGSLVFQVNVGDGV